MQKEHRAKFAEHHRAWLRFDAYSRVAMALGINQMLQSMSYFIAGPVQKHRPSFALITVMGVQAIAFFLLKLDWRTMDPWRNRARGILFEIKDLAADLRDWLGDEDTENSDDESEKPNKRKDVSSLEGSEFVFICITYLLPPVLLVVILWIAHYFFSDPTTGDLDHQGRIVSRVLSTPIFFLHAIWLYLVRQSIAPHHNDLLPVRLRTVGYLDVFTRDALVEELMQEDDEEMELQDRGHLGHEPAFSAPFTALLSWIEEREALDHQVAREISSLRSRQDALQAGLQGLQADLQAVDDQLQATIEVCLGVVAGLEAVRCALVLRIAQSSAFLEPRQRGAFFRAGWASPSARLWKLWFAFLGPLRPVRLAAALVSQAPIVRLALSGGRYSETGNLGQVSELDFGSSSGRLPSMTGKRLLPVASWCQVGGDWWSAQVGTRLTVLRASISDAVRHLVLVVVS
eukprot:s7352_g1.t1